MRLALLPLLLSAGWLFADPPAPPAPAPVALDQFQNLPRLLLNDVKHELSAPGRWSDSDWIVAWAGTAAVVGSMFLLDRTVDEAVVRNRNSSWSRVAKSVEQLGGAPSVLIAGGIYLGGIAFKEPEVRATGVDLMMTMAISQLLVTVPLKYGVGRSRPFENKGTHDIHPFRGGISFPSGHTTQAFALASVISEHADRPWVSCVAYGLAGLVGLSRMEERNHFFSDVVTGGLLGTLVGKSVVRYNQSLRAEGRAKVAVAFAPVFVPGGGGVSLSVKF